MTKTAAKPIQVIYYISSGQNGPQGSEGRSASALLDNLVERSRGEIQRRDVGLMDFDTDSLNDHVVPREIMLLAHSDPKRTTIGDKSPENLAKELAAKFKDKDKNTLESIKLVACEGGFGANPLAFRLVKALRKSGFTKVVVHAATHPQESYVGGFVSVTTKPGMSAITGAKVGDVSAVMYGNQKTADYARYQDLKKIRVSERSEDEGKEFAALGAKYANFSDFNDKSPDYCVIQLVNDIDDLNADYNTYTPDGCKGNLSIDVAIALDYLRHQRKLFKQLDDADAVEALSKIITDLQKNSLIGKIAILEKIDSVSAEYSMFGSAKELVEDLKKPISDAIDQKTQLMGISPQSKQKTNHVDLAVQENFLDRMLAKDSIFQKILRFITGNNSFTQVLADQLSMIKTAEVLLVKQRTSIKSNIDAERVKDKSEGKLTSLTFDTAIAKVYKAMDAYFENQSDDSWRKFESQYNKYKEDKKTYHNPKLEAQVEKLKANNESLKQQQEGRKEIKLRIERVIASYLRKHEKEHDEIHDAKRGVVNAIKKYVEEPCDENWDAIDAITKQSSGWNKGFFSQVALMKVEVERFHDEEKQMRNAQ